MGSVISQPSMTFNILPATNLVSNNDQRVLIIGGMLAVGTATAGEVYKNLTNDPVAIRALFGAGSMLAESILSGAFAETGVVQFDAIPLDDSTGTVASGTITFTGPATEDGSLTVVIGSERNNSYTIPVADAATETQIGDDVAAAINADDTCQCTASNAVGVVTLTSKNTGEIFNKISIEVVGSVSGVTTAINLFSGGINPTTLATDVAAIFAKIDKIRYQTVVWPYSDELDEIVSFMDARFNVDDAVMDGVVLTHHAGIAANMVNYANTFNSQNLVLVSDLVEAGPGFEGPAIAELPYVAASQLAAVRALRLTSGASIARLITGRNGALDSFGGPAIASLPYFNTPMSNLPVPAEDRGFSHQEIENLHDAGASVIGSNVTGTEVLLGEMVTTYKTDSAGNPDVSFKYLNYVDTSSNIREYFWNNCKARFAQSRLTTGDLVRGRNIANEDLIRGFITGLYSELSGPDFVLTQAGEDALQFFKQNLDVSIDLSTGLVTLSMVVPIVTQFREMLAAMQISFSANG